MEKKNFRYWFSEHILLASLIFAIIYQAIDILLNYFISGELKEGFISFYKSADGVEDLMRFGICLTLFLCHGLLSKATVTELRKLQEDQTLHLNEIKNFSNSVSHDLKSPAIGVHGLARLLLRNHAEKLDEKGRGICKSMMNASEFILDLVEDINTFQKTREIPMRFEKIRVKEIFELIREEFSPRLQANRIEWHEPDDIPELKADRIFFHRLFRNLVDNALKFGGDSMNRIIIEYTENGGFHTFLFHDNGPGIHEEDHERIFEPFLRLSQAKKTEGSGLGLAIVREIVEKHDGKIQVNSVPDKGTSFCFTISKDL